VEELETGPNKVVRSQKSTTETKQPKSPYSRPQSSSQGCGVITTVGHTFAGIVLKMQVVKVLVLNT